MQLKNAKAPAAVGNSGEGGYDEVACTDETTAAEHKSQIQSYGDLRRLTRDLGTIADWLDDLRSRIDRAHLRFQVFGLDEEEHEQLAAEVSKFKQVCAALCGTPRRLEQKERRCRVSYSPLDLVENYLRRFVAYPSEHALTAHVLWIAHTHLIECFDTTPRLALMSAEKESGKTRVLEMTELFALDPIFSFNASPAVIMRLVSSSRRTLLYDEIDQVFGTMKARETNAELCGYLNSGYRRGAKAYRCTTNGKKIEPEEFDAFAAVAIAGLRDLPDTLASRSIFIHMKHRAPDEQVKSFRQRYHRAEAQPIKEALAEWCAANDLSGVEPELPEGITDRTADCWEPLIAIADAAGGDWPERARKAAVFLTRRSSDETMTIGVEL